MFDLHSELTILIYPKATDMRKSFNGLSGLVINSMDRNPMSGDVYVFINRSRTKMKLLKWESGGFVLFYKQLEEGTFSVDKNITDVTYTQLSLIIQGMEIKKYNTRKRYNLSND